jgi:hypothetical protein
MLKLLLSWVTGGGLSGVADRIGDAYERKLQAQTDSEKMQIDAEIATLTLQQQVLIAEQANWLTRWIRPAFALPFVIYDFKIVVWDKVLKLGTTDPLSSEFWQLQMIVFGAFFITRPFEKRRTNG